MSYRELEKKIPTSMYEMLTDKIIDALLEAKEGANITSSQAKTILYHSMKGQLASKAGIANLVEALIIADRQRAVEIMNESGLKEAALALKPAES